MKSVAVPVYCIKEYRVSDPSDTLIWIEELDPPHVTLTYSVWPWQNGTHVARRVSRLCRKYARGWHCQRCNELMPVWKRVDAVYCCESCRKLAARERRHARMESWVEPKVGENRHFGIGEVSN